MTNTDNTPSDFWVISYRRNSTLWRFAVYGVNADEAIQKANKRLNCDGGFGMRRLYYREVANYLGDVLGN